MKKSFLIALSVHVVVLAFVWVGLPVPNTPQRVHFYYSQLNMPAHSDGFIFQTILPAISDPLFDQHRWDHLRTIDKPRK